METSDRIIEGLYLGGVMAALSEKDLQDKKITHILSVDEKPLPDILTQKLTYKHVFALDLYDFDLLSVLPECVLFIDQAIEGHCAILVHCQAGMSRSATVVAAYLMYKQGLSKAKALEHVSSCRPLVRPNDGFQEQLQLLENMGGQVNRGHSEFRAYQLNKLAVKSKCGQFAGGVPEHEIPSEVFVQPDYSGKSGDAYYKCRKCRVFLFHEGASTQHYVGQGESAFDWRSKIPANKRQRSGEGDAEVICTKSLFVDPLVWMKGKISSIAGKLHCPKCNAKIGSYIWYGEKCPCGAWVAPAFHIDYGKVDKIPSQPVMPRTHTPATRAGRASASVTPPPGRPRGVVEGFPSSGRPISQLSEATTAAVAARLTSTHPEAAVATVSPLTVPVASVAPSSAVTMATVTPMTSMEMDSSDGSSRGIPRSGVTAAVNRDLESGISSMNMDVDS
ncbi:dual specificity protein phosphatase 12 [Aplysia californica]|uniref:protein-tyrosine-phosphatase n=1 Tax=Aplysia californica TaxID=6500 RepID=A0ABM0K098_APLCA|nr:dual specificity protein phosphatase 12 [Aplysia californica]